VVPIEVNVHMILDTVGPMIFEEMPEICPHCGFTGFEELEILGTCEGPLFWKCFACDEYFLRFDKKVTREHLDNLRELFIDFDEQTLENLCLELPN